MLLCSLLKREYYYYSFLTHNIQALSFSIKSQLTIYQKDYILFILCVFLLYLQKHKCTSLLKFCF